MILYNQIWIGIKNAKLKKNNRRLFCFNKQVINCDCPVVHNFLIVIRKNNLMICQPFKKEKIRRNTSTDFFKKIVVRLIVV